MSISSVVSSVTGMTAAVAALVRAGLSVKVVKAVSEAATAIAASCRVMSAQDNVREAISDLLLYTATRSRKSLARAIARLTHALQIDDEIEELAEAQKEIAAEEPTSVNSVAEAAAGAVQDSGPNAEVLDVHVTNDAGNR